MPEFSSATKKLIRRYQTMAEMSQPKEGVIMVHADEIASKVATFYEKIREIVEWREEHLMRRTTIHRILKRKFFLAQDSYGTADNLVLELIRGGHFPNDSIEKSKIKKVQKIINKYTYILNNSPIPSRKKTKSELYVTIFEVAACEIEETLSPQSHLKVNALIEYMESIMKERIRVGKKAMKMLKGQFSEEEKNTQIYIAAHESLFRLDEPIITYNLLKRRYPNWLDLPEEILQEIAENIHMILDDIDKKFSHPLSNKFYKICEKYDTPFLLLGDIFSDKDPIETAERIFEPKDLEKAVKDAYAQRLLKLKSRNVRYAIFSTISIFLSKVLSVSLLEIPVALYVFNEQFNFFTQSLDVVVPVIFMALMVGTIKLPPKENLQIVINEMMKNVYERENKDIYEVEIYPRRGIIFRVVIFLLYVASFCFSFWLMIWGWDFIGIHLPPFSHVIFVLMMCLIAYAGMRIRQNARELHMIEPKDTLFNFIIDPLAMPVLWLGKRMSLWWKKHNIISVAFNILLDTPFLTFIEFLEQWRYFLKEKKEDIH